MVAIVVMGIAGSGKSTIGVPLARSLRVPYIEADDFHSPVNRLKMASGRPLTDEDREPWLDTVSQLLRDHVGTGFVTACSALRRNYRDRLRAAVPETWFLHLVLDEATAARRVAARSTHFMPATLVPSQLAALEPLEDEAGFAVDATRPPEQILATALAHVPAGSSSTPMHP